MYTAWNHHGRGTSPVCRVEWSSKGSCSTSIIIPGRVYQEGCILWAIWTQLSPGYWPAQHELLIRGRLCPFVIWCNICICSVQSILLVPSVGTSVNTRSWKVTEHELSWRLGNADMIFPLLVVFIRITCFFLASTHSTAKCYCALDNSYYEGVLNETESSALFSWVHP